MKTTLEILTQARELLSDPARWTQGVLAQCADGATTCPNDPDAVCWCFHGALYRAAGIAEYRKDSARRAYALLRQHLGGELLSTFNDTHTHAQVLAALDHVIAQERNA